MGIRALVLAFVVACSGGGSKTGPDGGGSVDAPPGAQCGEAACDGACGSAIEACGSAVACPRCSFDGEDVGSATGPVELVLGTSPQIAAADTLWRKDAAWTSEQPLPTFSTITGFAVAPDGTRWVVYLDSSDLAFAASDSGGTWASTQLGNASFGSPPRVAIAGDGTVYVAFGGSDMMSHEGLIVATRTPDGTWTTAEVMHEALGPKFVDITLVADVPWIAWTNDDDSSLRVSHGAAGAFTTETADTNVPQGADHDLSIAADAAGTVHVAYRQDSPLFREIDHAVRDASGTWHTEPAAVMHHGNNGEVSMAIAGNGDVSIAYVDQFGVGLATHHAGTWSKQMLGGGDGGISAALAYDASGTLHAAVASASGLRLLTRSGLYPADYDATCSAVAAAICPKACECGTSEGSRCYQTSTSYSGCSDPEPFCEEAVGWAVCGDASQPASAITTCQGAVTTLACSGTHVMVPDACPFGG
jgi:hypothetical protein